MDFSEADLRDLDFRFMEPERWIWRESEELEEGAAKGENGTEAQEVREIARRQRSNRFMVLQKQHLKEGGARQMLEKQHLGVFDAQLMDVSLDSSTGGKKIGHAI